VDEDLEPLKPLLEAVASKAELDLIASLLATGDDLLWLTERLADALRD
jgi:hypothetical protein